jgi:hypothetical protein
MNPLVVSLAVSLAVSAAGNVWLGKAYLGKRDTAVVATTNLEHASVDVQACNSSVDNLGVQSDKRAAAAAPARAAATASAGKSNAKADAILSTPATQPGDDCKSATARANNWFKETP